MSVALRGLGLTLKEIEQLAGVYLGRPDEPIEGQSRSISTASTPERRSARAVHSYTRGNIDHLGRGSRLRPLILAEVESAQPAN